MNGQERNESYRKIRHDGKEKTSCTQGGRGEVMRHRCETLRQEDNHTGGKPDETDGLPE